MNDATNHPRSAVEPRVPVAVRPATPDDLPFIDALQKRHTEQVGWMPTKQLEGKIAAGHVLVALVARASSPCPGNDGVSDTGRMPVPQEPLGYVISRDQYMKRDDCGIIYQVNVVPSARRMLVGAALVKAVFERAAYGCRLFCCWCAQDIEANRFWESLGFVPLAYRAGSASRGRVHVFWQRRVRAGDETTPWWFPAQTSAGAIRADRIVLPIPPGMHWSEAKPILLPGAEGPRRLEGRRAKAPARPPAPPANTIRAGGLRFAAAVERAPKEPREPAPRAKNDPKLVAAARELRDRWLEHVNAGGLVAGAKYDVGRALPQSAEAAGPVHVAAMVAPPRRMLPAA